MKAFFRANPQVLVLLVICVVLGLGTFLAVVFGLLSSGSTQTDGEPSGLVAPGVDRYATATPGRPLGSEARAVVVVPARA